MMVPPGPRTLVLLNASALLLVRQLLVASTNPITSAQDPYRFTCGAIQEVAIRPHDEGCVTVTNT